MRDRLCKGVKTMIVKNISNRIIDYIVVCVEEFAERFNVSGDIAYNYLKEYGGIDFLIKHYEIEHTLGIDDAIDDITEICIKHGGVLQ